MAIYLGLPSPAASSNLPEADGQPYASCSVLLRVGFTCAPPVTRRAVVSYTALPPYLPGRSLKGGTFLLHCPWSRLRQTLSGTLPCEARTFLSRGLAVSRQRPPVLLTTCISLSQNRGFVQRNPGAFPCIPTADSCIFLKSSAEIGNVAVTGHHGNFINLAVGIAHQLLGLFHAQL